jgi:hypothetical protein
MQINSKTLAAQACVVLATCLFGAALAAPPEPPPKAFAACASKVSGDKCTVQFHEHEMTGTCAAFSENLACRPDHPQPGGHGGAGGPHGLS